MRIPLSRDRVLVVHVRRRCRHQVYGICPRCYPQESRTLRNVKLALSIAWLERIATLDPHADTADHLRSMAAHALEAIAKLKLPERR